MGVESFLFFSCCNELAQRGRVLRMSLICSYGLFLQIEMQTMLDLGVQPSKIVYANPCKQASHIR